MKVYHSSSVEVKRPDTKHSRAYLDFGSGFYVTTLKEQAEKYAERFLRRGSEAWLNVYEFHYDESLWNVLRFEQYDKRWLDYVLRCRQGEPVEDYDLIIGGIADDKVFRTLDLYFAGDITETEALKRLVYEKPNIQLCIRSEQMLEQCLTFIESVKL